MPHGERKKVQVVCLPPNLPNPDGEVALPARPNHI